MVRCCLLQFISFSSCSLHMDIYSQGSLWTLQMVPWDQTAVVHHRTERHRWLVQGHCRTEPAWQLLRKEWEASSSEGGCKVHPRDKGMIGKHHLILHFQCPCLPHYALKCFLPAVKRLGSIFPVCFQLLLLVFPSSMGVYRAARKGSIFLVSCAGKMKEGCRTWKCFLVLFFSLVIRLWVFLYIWL